LNSATMFNNTMPKWIAIFVWAFFGSTCMAQTNLVLNGDLELMKKMPLPTNLSIDGILLEFEEDSSYFQPLVGEQHPLTNIAAPYWNYTTLDSINFSAQYSSIGYSHSGTNFKLIQVYRGSVQGSNAHVVNAVVSLCKPLQEGSKYKIEFYIKPFSGTAYTDNIGVAVIDKETPTHFEFAQRPPIKVKSKKLQKGPQQLIIVPSYKLPNILMDTSKYSHVSFVYTARGGESYVYIGNIFFEEARFWSKSSWRPVPFYGYEKHKSRFFICNYAIDDVKVVALDEMENGCPMILFSHDESSDTVFLESFYYETDSAFTTIDFSSLIEKINNAPERYSVVINGYADFSGEDSYNLKLSQERADVIKENIESSINKPILAFGLGSIIANRKVDVYLVVAK
jgi:hypothetical protein